MKTLYTLIIALSLACIAGAFDLSVYTVSGGSMEPNYHEGDRVLVEKYLWHITGLSVGDVVIFDDARGRKTQDIKRVSDRPAEQGTYFLLGDNTAKSTDSREVGSIPESYIKGRVLMTL